MNNLTQKILNTIIITTMLAAPINTYAAARSFRDSYKTYQTKNQPTEIADQAPTLILPKGFVLPPIDDTTPIRIHQRIDHADGKIEYRWREIPYNNLKK